MGTSQENKLTANIVSSMARTLQELSGNYRRSQSAYLRSKKAAHVSAIQELLYGNLQGKKTLLTLVALVTTIVAQHCKGKFTK